MNPPLPPDAAVLRAELRRYIDEYRWSFPLVVKVINRLHGTNYTMPQLQEIYKSASLLMREIFQFKIRK